MNQGPTLQGDFLAVAVIDGKVELSFNLGKQTKPVRIISDVSTYLGPFLLLLILGLEFLELEFRVSILI